MFRLLLVVIVLLGAARESEARPVKMPVLGWKVELPDEPWTVHETTVGETGRADYFMLDLGDRTLRAMVVSIARRCTDVMYGFGGVFARDSDGDLRTIEGLPETWSRSVITSKDPIAWTTCRDFGLDADGDSRSLQLSLVADGTERRPEDDARLIAIANALEPHVREVAGDDPPLDRREFERLREIVAQARAARSPTTLPRLGIRITPHPWRVDDQALVLDLAYQPSTFTIWFDAYPTDISCADGFGAEYIWEEDIATPSWAPAGFHRRALASATEADGSSTLELCADVPGGVMIVVLETKGVIPLSEASVALATLLQQMRASRPLELAPLSLAPLGGMMTLPPAANVWILGHPDPVVTRSEVALERSWPKDPARIDLAADRATCIGQPPPAFVPPEWKSVSSKTGDNEYSKYRQSAYVVHEVCTTSRDGRRIRAWISGTPNTTPTRIAGVTALLSAISAHVGAKAPVVPGTIAKPLTWFPKRDAVGFGLGYRSGDTGGGVDLAVALQTGSLEINFGGMLSGPESATLLGKAAVNVFSFLDPRVSRVSLSFSVGATAFLYTKPGEDPNAEVLWLRGYLGAKLRVRCGLSLRASYEPSFSDTKPDVFGVGLEAAIEGSRKVTVCSR